MLIRPSSRLVNVSIGRCFTTVFIATELWIILFAYDVDRMISWLGNV